MLILRIDAWRYRVGMAVSAMVVFVGTPVGLVLCVMLALDLL
jgi:hypothetical protein